tara:strand:- start:32216 stop:32443 length:228 start_codon:yes stop_codon:yes gene_type:complete
MTKIDELEEALRNINDTVNRLEETSNRIAKQVIKKEELLNLYRDAVVIDPKMDGPVFSGCNISALKRAWEKDNEQ